MSYRFSYPARCLPLWLAALAAWLLPASLAMALAIGEPIAFETEAQQRQYQTLVRELRCTVCQSETIHESNAELAADMRRRVYQMTLDGHDGDAIVDFMVQRYGDYVRYRPPLQANTAVLWASPFLLVLIGAGVWWQIIRGRRQMAQRPEFTAQERAALKRLDRRE